MSHSPNYNDLNERATRRRLLITPPQYAGQMIVTTSRTRNLSHHDRSPPTHRIVHSHPGQPSIGLRSVHEHQASPATSNSSHESHQIGMYTAYPIEEDSPIDGSRATYVPSGRPASIIMRSVSTRLLDIQRIESQGSGSRTLTRRVTVRRNGRSENVNRFIDIQVICQRCHLEEPDTKVPSGESVTCSLGHIICFDHLYDCFKDATKSGYEAIPMKCPIGIAEATVCFYNHNDFAHMINFKGKQQTADAARKAHNPNHAMVNGEFGEAITVLKLVRIFYPFKLQGLSV